MPVIEVNAPVLSPGHARLRELSTRVTTVLGIEPEHCWVLWRALDAESCHRPEWQRGSAAPVIFLTCKQSYSTGLVHQVLNVISTFLAAELGCLEHEVFIAVRRARSDELLARGAIWVDDSAPSMPGKAVTP
jgi:hypothetical protein